MAQDCSTDPILRGNKMRKSTRRQQKIPKKRRFSPEEKEKFAQHLRENMTPSEKLLWKQLKKKEVKFSPQVVVCGYIADFYCSDLRVVVEVDGAIHKYRKKQDAKRDSHMRKRGIRVLRYSNKQVNDNPDKVAADIIRRVRTSS